VEVKDNRSTEERKCVMGTTMWWLWCIETRLWKWQLIKVHPKKNFVP